LHITKKVNRLLYKTLLDWSDHQVCPRT